LISLSGSTVPELQFSRIVRRFLATQAARFAQFFALAAMPLRVGAGGQRVAAENLPYDEAAAELRAAEQIELSLTGTITGAPEILTYKFPEPADGAPTNPSSS
jgi:hypothetical protein